MHHLAVTYSGFGSWYYNERSHLDIISTVWFAFYLSLQQGYFMGLLFMIAGYFAAGSYDRKGFSQFVGERFKRLVIPALIYMVVITPFIGIAELGHKLDGFNIYGFLSGTGVMWFAVALFIFSLVYGLAPLIGHRPATDSNKKQLKPSFINAVILIQKFNYQSKFVKSLADSSFTVYMFHPPIIVAVALLFRPVALLPIIKWVILCIICVPLCFAAAHFILRRIPLLKNVL